MKKFINSPFFGIVMVGIVFGFFFLIYLIKENKNDYIESLNTYELFIYNLKEAEKDKQYATIKDLVEEHMINKREYGEIEEKLSEEEFDYMKKLYNESIRNLYFGNNIEEHYVLDNVIKQAYSDEIIKSALDEFIDIQRELLEPELEKKLYTDDLEKIVMKVEREKREYIEQLNKEIEEKKVYDFMKSAFNEITNYGDNYNPEIHDQLIAELASKEFGISVSEANDIYIKFAMKEVR